MTALQDPGGPAGGLTHSEGPCIEGNLGPLAREEYVGLSIDEAERLASRRGNFVEVIGTDGDCRIELANHQADRVNVDTVEGLVVAAYQG